MSNYHYENGANHYDYHKEYSICVKSVGDARSIIKELLNDDEEEVHFEEVVPKEEVIESSYNRNVSGEGLFALKMKEESVKTTALCSLISDPTVQEKSHAQL